MRNLLVIGSLLIFAVSAQAEFRMAFVDLHKVVQSTTVGKKTKADLEDQFQKKKRLIDLQEAKIKKQARDLEAQKGKISAAAFEKKQIEIEKQFLEYRDFSGRVQIEFQKKEIESTTPILEKIRRTIKKVSRESGYTVVIEKTAQILDFPEGDDITAKVVTEFEKGP